jgi:hypothetical protein
VKKLYLYIVRIFLIACFLFLGYNKASAQKSILSITPNSVTPGHTIDIVVRGINTNFKNGISTIDFGIDIQVLKFNVSNPETGIASIVIASNASPGFRNIKVSTGNEIVTLNNACEVFIGGGNFRAGLEMIPYQSDALSDFDISHPQSQPILYFVNLFNDNTPRNIKAYMTFYQGSGIELFTLSTDNIALTTMQVTRLTNRDFISFKLKKPEGISFLKDVTNKGALLPGEYIFKLVVTDENGIVIGSDENKTLLTNPLYNPELISPGANFGTNIRDVFTPFPFFQWFGQADKYDFALFEVIREQTPEDVVRNVKVFELDDITGSSLIYPIYAEKLLEGKTYAWQINGKIVTSKGTQKLPSEVFRFRYTIPGNVEGDQKNIARIVITPQQIELKPGNEYKFTAIIYDWENKPVTKIQPIWKVVPAGGTVSQDGVFTAEQDPGTMAVVVLAGTYQDHAIVVIKPPGVGANDKYDSRTNWYPISGSNPVKGKYFLESGIAPIKLNTRQFHTPGFKWLAASDFSLHAIH